MDDRANPDPKEGPSLYEIGWRQGSLFDASSLFLAWCDIAPDRDGDKIVLEKREPPVSGRYVVISQDCDIAHGDYDDEPFIEVLQCGIAKETADLANLERNSPRFFLLDKERRLVALAMHRVQVAKGAVKLLAPEVWPYSQERFRNFIRWLGARYTRPAFPDEFNKLFANPATRVFQDMSINQRATFSQIVSEVRVLLARTEAELVRPYEVQLLIITKREKLTSDEDDALSTFLTRVAKKVAGEGAVKLDINHLIASDSMISVRLYFDSVQLPLDYYTYRGDIETGATPYDR